MKILHIATGYTSVLPDSGRSVENTIYHLSKWQAELGHEVMVADVKSSKPRGETKARFCEVGGTPKIRGFPCSMRVILYSLLSIPLILHLVASGVDIIHTHSQFPTLVAIMAKKLVKSKALVFYTAHSPYLTMPPSLSNRIRHTIAERWALRWAGRVIAQTDTVAREVCRRFGLDAQKVVQVYAGVDVEAIDRVGNMMGLLGNLDRKYTPPLGFVRMVLCPSYVNRRKNQMAVVKAVPRVLAKHPHCAFAFPGGIEDSGYLSEADAFMREQGISTKAFFMGQVTKEALYQLYRNADMVVLPTLFETQGVVLLEAMAFGLPVVASDIGAIRDVVKLKKGCALLVNPNDSREIGDAIIKVLGDKRLRARMSKRGRELVDDRFSWERVAWDTINKYVEALSGD